MLSQRGVYLDERNGGVVLPSKDFAAFASAVKIKSKPLAPLSLMKLRKKLLGLGEADVRGTREQLIARIEAKAGSVIGRVGDSVNAQSFASSEAQDVGRADPGKKKRTGSQKTTGSKRKKTRSKGKKPSAGGTVASEPESIDAAPGTISSLCVFLSLSSVLLLSYHSTLS